MDRTFEIEGIKVSTYSGFSLGEKRRFIVLSDAKNDLAEAYTLPRLWFSGGLVGHLKKHIDYFRTIRKRLS